MPTNSNPITLFGNNKGSNTLTINPKHYLRIKYIDIKYYYIRQLVEDKEVDIQYIPIAVIVADILIKPLTTKVFEEGRRLLGIYDYSYKYRYLLPTLEKARR